MYSNTLVSIKPKVNLVIQVRNHSKIYPWRFNRSNRECYLDTTKTPYTDRNNINEFRPSRKERKDWQKVIPKDKDNRFNAYIWNDCYTSDPKEAKKTATSRLQRLKDSLVNRGSAREADPYNPPDGVQERIVSLYRSLNQDNSSGDVEDTLNISLEQSRALKFTLITKCIDEFNHHLPNSYLNDVNTIRDLVEYFITPVRGVNPYAAMLKQDDVLPPNLSLIAEPMRFDKDSDQIFKGQSAFPGLIGKIPGLRAAKKYPVLNQDEFQWPDV